MLAKQLNSEEERSKMKIAHIAPKIHAHSAAEQSEVLMTLQHLCGDEQYVAVHARQTKYKFLDNGYFEKGESCSIEELIETGKEIKANCLILPDGDIRNATMVKEAGFDVMYIPIGNSLQDLIKDAVQALKRADVDFLGLSYIHAHRALGLRPHSMTARSTVIAGLTLHYVLPFNSIHILGGLAPHELAYLAHYAAFINSWDTSMAVWSGIHHMDVSEIKSKFGPSVEFDDLRKWTSICDSNIGYLKGMRDALFYNKKDV
jgi:hypothetical protein